MIGLIPTVQSPGVYLRQSATNPTVYYYSPTFRCLSGETLVFALDDDGSEKESRDILAQYKPTTAETTSEIILPWPVVGVKSCIMEWIKEKKNVVSNVEAKVVGKNVVVLAKEIPSRGRVLFEFEFSDEFSGPPIGAIQCLFTIKTQTMEIIKSMEKYNIKFPLVENFDETIFEMDLPNNQKIEIIRLYKIYQKTCENVDPLEVFNTDNEKERVVQMLYGNGGLDMDPFASIFSLQECQRWIKEIKEEMESSVRKWKMDINLHLEEETRIVTVGKFKQGKSLLLNQILMFNIFPVSTKVCTGDIWELHHSEEYRLEIETFGGKQPIRNCNCLDDLKKSIMELQEDVHCYRLLRIFCPQGIKGLIIVDTPGLFETLTKASRKAAVCSYIISTIGVDPSSIPTESFVAYYLTHVINNSLSDFFDKKKLHEFLKTWKSPNFVLSCDQNPNAVLMYVRHANEGQILIDVEIQWLRRCSSPFYVIHAIPHIQQLLCQADTVNESTTKPDNMKEHLASSWYSRIYATGKTGMDIGPVIATIEPSKPDPFSYRVAQLTIGRLSDAIMYSAAFRQIQSLKEYVNQAEQESSKIVTKIGMEFHKELNKGVRNLTEATIIKLNEEMKIASSERYKCELRKELMDIMHDVHLNLAYDKEGKKEVYRVNANYLKDLSTHSEMKVKRAIGRRLQLIVEFIVKEYCEELVKHLVRASPENPELSSVMYSKQIYSFTSSIYGILGWTIAFQMATTFVSIAGAEAVSVGTTTAVATSFLGAVAIPLAIGVGVGILAYKALKEVDYETEQKKYVGQILSQWESFIKNTEDRTRAEIRRLALYATGVISSRSIKEAISNEEMKTVTEHLKIIVDKFMDFDAIRERSLVRNISLSKYEQNLWKQMESVAMVYMDSDNDDFVQPTTQSESDEVIDEESIRDDENVTNDDNYN